MDDLVIRGGMVLDGAGAPAARADVAIRHGAIVSVSPRSASTGREVLDADGLVVAPGFIDVKTHSDFTRPWAPATESKVFQGVATEVIGGPPAPRGRSGLIGNLAAGKIVPVWQGLPSRMWLRGP